MILRFGTTTAAAALAVGLTSMSAQADLLFKPGEDPRFNWESYEALKANDLSGKTVTVFGPWLGPDKDLVENTMAYFEEATGIDVQYSGSDSFEQQIVIDTQAGSAPDVSIFPQPGLASDLAGKGFLAPLGSDTADWVRDNYAAGQSWVDLGTFKGKDGEEELFGFFYKVDVKSLVWYSPDNFDDAGYDVPQTMEELKALTEQIVADGGTPWCIGLGSGGATGWPGTDWVEDMMLRTQPPEVYDQWVRNEIPFNDPKVVGAIEEFGWFANNEKFVDTPGAVAASDFRDSPKGLFSSPPACYMHRQASFIPSFFPEGTEMGVDADFFYFPAYEGKDLGAPVLGAGTVFALTNDTPEGRALIEFLKSPIAHEVWMAQSGFLTPHKGVNVEAYADDTLKGLGEILLGATTFRFDGSDLMPGAVGAGSFWTGMVDFVGGKPADQVGTEIQASWDAIK
ncbi:carbohydrate ABC transporter substrate-binding protein [Roseibium polysiphoniae]|uniref:Carbohydrate ABC transporter substrate-binding protein n=1 Tax=Roseibium polysiphoniae TaxID=2571221 RepID=A0A944GTV0_9HYPH|nr:ABC transporter substrate-binding protein [Roseibium polysiphoniae]MBS8260860.1 carbohydrate ABC transporter substrate-binding protein [Roseibium polysiphoniae]